MTKVEQALATIDSALALLQVNRETHLALLNAMAVVQAACKPAPPADTGEPITGTVEPEG